VGELDKICVETKGRKKELRKICNKIGFNNKLNIWAFVLILRMTRDTINLWKDLSQWNFAYKQSFVGI
jgi:hypothetical protein